MAKPKDIDYEMEDFLKHRFDDDLYDYYDYLQELHYDDDDEGEALSELEDREYWRNVLADELRANNK